ncbi:MAG: ribbon-helix-helix protein, CopG family [Sphingopyxis sp.]|uniref:ribbon-helix-helix protein, CopG family n=1 Tax=Sphingopyxis sp. TaxID=1908224 RepID=UPI001A2404B5|nr:ribbon-helix-helix protein, CopG family [Sphingopyxis sp.]MBJ7499672.1 ribbon-helix-helix protein, CopG family [Sphingopyxis sp.]
MRHTFVQTSLRIEAELPERFDRIAAQEGITRAAAMRMALRAYADAAEQIGSSQRRLAHIAEYMQMAIDVIIREQFPEYRDRLVEETPRRVERYHGAS